MLSSKEKIVSETLQKVPSILRPILLSVAIQTSQLLGAPSLNSGDIERYIASIQFEIEYGRSFSNAQRLADEMVEKYKIPLSYMTRAKVFLASGDKKSALKDMQKIKSLIKNDKEAQLFYFGVLFANDMHQECIIGLNKMLADFGEDADVYEFLGKSYQNVGKYFESIVCYEKALELGSRSGEIPTNLLTAKHALKEQDEAIKSPEDVILSVNPVVVQKRIQKKKKHQ